MDDNCAGQTAARISWQQYDQWDAFLQADLLIRNANEYLEEISGNQQWNQAELGATVSELECVMIRYVLDEVYIHCSTDAQNINFPFISNTERNFFRDVNNLYSEGIDISVSDVSGDVNGFAALGGEYSVVEDFGSKLLVHEVAHNLTLRHTFEGNPNSNDGCDDTPWTTWEYDRDDDGTVDDTGPFCFNTYNTQDFDPQFCDPDGLNAVNVHPCCTDEHQDNNVMTYSVHSNKPESGAFTLCQMNKMLGNLLNRKCDYIRAINPTCPPVSAFIGVPANVDIENECKFRLNFRASTNETSFRIVYEVEKPDGTFSTFSATDWTEGRARSITIGIEQENAVKNVDIILEGGRTYNVILETKNACGDTDHHVVRFTAKDCDLPKETDETFDIDPDRIEISPNPFGKNMQLSYELLKAGSVEIFYYSLGSGGTGGKPVLKVSDSGFKAIGKHFVSFADTEMGEGLNYIVVYAGGKVFVKRAIKN